MTKKDTFKQEIYFDYHIVVIFFSKGHGKKTSNFPFIHTLNLKHAPNGDVLLLVILCFGSKHYTTERD